MVRVLVVVCKKGALSFNGLFPKGQYEIRELSGSDGWEIDPFYADQQADYYTNYISLTKGDEKFEVVHSLAKWKREALEKRNEFVSFREKTKLLVGMMI